ncbi:hypothetical protein Tco_0927307 [Tanacetum coccineum]
MTILLKYRRAAVLHFLQTKRSFKSAPSLPHIPIDHHHLVASPDIVLDKINSFPRGTSCGRNVLCAQHLMDCLSGSDVAISDELVSLSPIDDYLDDPQFGVGVSRGGEAILHVMNHLIEDPGDDVGRSMLLVDFRNAFNLAWYLNDGTIIEDTLVVGKVLELIMKDDPRCGLHLNVDKAEFFFAKGRPEKQACNSEVEMKRVAKTIVLFDAVAKINDPQCDFLLLRACTSILKLYFAMRTCPTCVHKSARRSFDVPLCCTLERIVWC